MAPHHAFTGGAGALGVLQLTPPTNMKKQKKKGNKPRPELPPSRASATQSRTTIVPIAEISTVRSATTATASTSQSRQSTAQGTRQRTRTREARSEAGESTGSHSPTNAQLESLNHSAGSSTEAALPAGSGAVAIAGAAAAAAERASWVQIFRAAQEERARERDEREQLVAQRIKDGRTRDGTTMLPRRHSEEAVGHSSTQAQPTQRRRRERTRETGQPLREQESQRPRPRRNTLERRMNRTNVWDDLETTQIELPPWTPTDPNPRADPFETAGARDRADSSSSGSTVDNDIRAPPLSPPPSFQTFPDALTTQTLKAEQQWKDDITAGLPLELRLQKWRQTMSVDSLPVTPSSEPVAEPEQQSSERIEWRGFKASETQIEPRPRSRDAEASTIRDPPAAPASKDVMGPPLTLPAPKITRSSEDRLLVSSDMPVKATSKSDESHGSSILNDSEPPALIREAILHRTPTLTTRRTALAAAAERRLRTQLLARSLLQVPERSASMDLKDEQHLESIKSSDVPALSTPSALDVPSERTLDPRSEDESEGFLSANESATVPNTGHEVDEVDVDMGALEIPLSSVPSITRPRPKGPRPPSPQKSKSSLHVRADPAASSTALEQAHFERSLALAASTAPEEGPAEAQAPSKPQSVISVSGTEESVLSSHGPPTYRKTGQLHPSEEKLQATLISDDGTSKGTNRIDDFVAATSVKDLTKQFSKRPSVDEGRKLARRPIVLKFKGRSQSSKSSNDGSGHATPAVDASRIESRVPQTRTTVGVYTQSRSNVSSSDESSRSFASAVAARPAASSLTELDLLLNRIGQPSNEATRYDDLLLLSDMIGPAIPTRAMDEEIGRLSVAPVESGALGKKTVMGVQCDTCAICLLKLEDTQMAAVMPQCLHVFHQDCTESWLARVHTCPVCRLDISSIGPST